MYKYLAVLRKKKVKETCFYHLNRCKAKFYHAGAKDAVGNVSADVLCGQLAQRKEHGGAALRFHWELSLPVKVKMNPWVGQALRSVSQEGFAGESSHFRRICSSTSNQCSETNFDITFLQ